MMASDLGRPLADDAPQQVAQQDGDLVDIAAIDGQQCRGRICHFMLLSGRHCALHLKNDNGLGLRLNSPPMLHVNGLTYRIAGRLLLDDASVAIPEGHKVGLVGPQWRRQIDAARI